MVAVADAPTGESWIPAFAGMTIEKYFRLFIGNKK
jgi:hypothetical protein